MDTIIEMLNLQYNKELYNAFIYRNFSSLYHNQGLKGWAALYDSYAKEEERHAEDFRKFIIDLGYTPVITSLASQGVEKTPQNVSIH
jgi:ferritin